jgi:hypothetical protein
MIFADLAQAARHGDGGTWRRRQILIVNARTESEIDAAFAAIVRAGAGALFIGTSAFYNSRRSGTHPKERDLQPSKIRDMKFIAAALDYSHTGRTL